MLHRQLEVDRRAGKLGFKYSFNSSYLQQSLIRAVSPEQYKLARSWKSISDEFHLQDRDPAFSGLDAPSFNSSISSMSVALFGPQNSEERLKMRATRSNSPIKEEFVEEVLRVSDIYIEFSSSDHNIGRVPTLSIARLIVIIQIRPHNPLNLNAKDLIAVVTTLAMRL